MPNLNGASDLSGLLRLPNLKVLKTYEDDGKFIIVVASILPQIKTPCCLFTDVKKNGTKAIRFRDFAVQKQETWLEIKRQRFTCGLCGKDERTELQYSHERRESDVQFHRVERKMLEALYFDRPRFSGRDLRHCQQIGGCS